MNPLATFPASSPDVADAAVRGLRRVGRLSQEILIRVFDRLNAWQDCAASRRRLASLDDRMLHDIAVDRAAAAAEASKPFWKGC